MTVIKFYQFPGLTTVEVKRCEKKLQSLFEKENFAKKEVKVTVETQNCFYIETSRNVITAEEEMVLLWVLRCPFGSRKILKSSFINDKESFEIGPRLNFSTAFSTNGISICRSVGLTHISRIEKSIHYLVKVTINNIPLSIQPDLQLKIMASLHDKMTEMVYATPVTSFDIHASPEPVFEIDLLGEGKSALEKTSKKLGLSFDAWDIDFYNNLFVSKLNRNPTSVECFDLAQSNSEHCRHWYFKGRFIIDSQICGHSLFEMVINTQRHTNQNNVIKFSDNSSAIKGYAVRQLRPEVIGTPSSFILPPPSTLHIVFTAETHNFPTGVAPFQGATTGTGGRIRDVQATGRGARVVAGTAGYCVGCLNIPDYNLPWESTSSPHPHNLAKPLDILIEASNGASDYGNKFGEPILAGFSRSFGMLDVSGERREWLKPIMFTAGIGSMYDTHINKLPPSVGMSVVKVGGPVLRIGVGGGSASSVSVQDDARDDLDFNAVQRGDAEMGEKMNRVIRACFEQADDNPICSIHDQGAGGNGNVLKELCHPGGAEVKLSAFELADPSLSALEVWTAEYQESNAMLVRDEKMEGLLSVARRERCGVSVVGKITGDNMMTFVDDRIERTKKKVKQHAITTTRPAIQLDLDLVLGKVPRKDYHVTRIPTNHLPIHLPNPLSVCQALQRVLRLPSVASKRFLTSKVDRSVTGLVAQQQCVGALHTPLADVAVVALSHFDVKGSATAIGEQPIKCLVDPGCGARMAVAESLTNLVWAYVGDIKDVKCSANWMWPAKLPGEDARLYDACVAMTTLLGQLGVGVDGGKDSLSMAAKVDGRVVKSPGSLVISTYAACEDITLTVTPDFKCPEGRGHLFHIPLSPGHHRLGGTALAQCYGFLGCHSPDLENSHLFVQAFHALQELIKGRKIRSGHDVSDGGLLTCVLEMAFAANCGLELDLEAQAPMLDYLFNEEAGYVIEVAEVDVDEVCGVLRRHEVAHLPIGFSKGMDVEVSVKYNTEVVLTGATPELRHIWEDTSFHLEYLQSSAACVDQEAAGLLVRKGPNYKVIFDPDQPITSLLNPVASTANLRVALIREEGSNGDREMAAALFMAGFIVVDVNMQDLISKSISLEQFRGVVFVGGFSYADVFGSAKGWATAIKFNEDLGSQFNTFFQRSDTFSLGVCNGCQLMSYLGWIGTDVANKENNNEQGIMLEKNLSERYESRFVSVRVEESVAMMLQGMHDSVLGVWVAHGEGRFKFRNDQILSTIKDNNLISLTYADDNGQATQQYPMNPNGSQNAVAAVCSQDGRHLAMMPHPERTVLRWQWPWIPEEGHGWKTSPWLRMFTNAHQWCLDNASEIL